MRALMNMLVLMVLMWPPEILATDLPSPADCRRADTPACRTEREAACQRRIEEWLDKLEPARAGTPDSAATSRALTEARERIAGNQRKQVPACQTLYELNGGRDPCKHSDTAECQAEKQRRCGTAIDSFLKQAMHIDQTVPPRDAARGSLLAEFSKRVRDNRGTGVPECQTWAEIMKMAATQ